MNKIKFIFRAILRKIFPIKNNRIVFTSYGGHYNDSSKYIFEQMYKMNPNLDYIWLVNDKYFDDVPKYVKKVKYGSLKADFYYGTSHIIIDNVHSFKSNYLISNTFFNKIQFMFMSFLCSKNNQLLYTTWHGTPLKKIGCDQVDSNIIDCSCPNTTFLLGDEHTLKILERIHFNKVESKLIGCPRNDILHCDNVKIKEIKKKLNLPIDKKLVLFAPTFRSNGSIENKDLNRSGVNQLNEIDFNLLFKTLNNKFGDDWAFIGRFHYHVEKMINWVELKNKYGDKIINGNFGDDMAQYLACTDVLITDASSCMFDFMITKKPIFLFFPDYDHYLNVERGLYYDIEKLPFPFSKDFNGLIENIKKFDNNSYEKNVEKLEKEFNVVIDSNSSKKVAEYILKENNLL